MTGQDLAEAALSLVGCRFRLHGRDPATGLDCVGTVAAALAAIGHPVAVPSGYGLRLTMPDARLNRPEAFGLVEAGDRPCRPGDIQIIAPGPAQVHFAIAVHGPAHVHAHAALRRVVLTPGPPAGRLLHRWCLAQQGF